MLTQQGQHQPFFGHPGARQLADLFQVAEHVFTPLFCASLAGPDHQVAGYDRVDVRQQAARLADAHVPQQGAVGLVGDRGVVRPALQRPEPELGGLRRIAQVSLRGNVTCGGNAFPGRGRQQRLQRTVDHRPVVHHARDQQHVGPGLRIVRSRVQVFAEPPQRVAQAQLQHGPQCPAAAAFGLVLGGVDGQVDAVHEVAIHLVRGGVGKPVVPPGGPQLVEPEPGRLAVRGGELGVDGPCRLELLVGLEVIVPVRGAQRARAQRDAPDVGLVRAYRARADIDHVLQCVWVQGGVERGGDLHRHVFLDGDHVFQRPVVGLRPGVEAVGHTGQLGGHADPVPGGANRAFQQVRDTEFTADGGQVFLRAAVEHRRLPRGHLDIGHARQGIGDLLGESVREPLLVLLLAEVVEGQHGHRAVDLFHLRGLPGERRRFAFLGEVDALHQDQRDNHHQRTDDEAVKLDRALLRLGFPLFLAPVDPDAVRRQLQCPRRNQCGNDADHENHEDQAVGPVRQAQHADQDVGHLDDAPGHHQVGDGHAVNVAPFQFPEKVGQCSLPVRVSWCSEYSM